MRPFERLEGIAAPLPIENVDTDKILPGRFLKTIKRSGLGAALFFPLRGDPNFVLNRHPWREAQILISLENFGCGSSREHAPWALADFGIRCVIAPSIADIFRNNCCKNGILPIAISRSIVDLLMNLASHPETATFAIDLRRQTIESAAGVQSFEIDPQRRADLLDGADDIAKTLSLSAVIDAFEREDAMRRPWFCGVGPSQVNGLG